MRLVILTINEDIINSGVASATVGIFDREGRKQMEFFLPGRLFAKDHAYKKGQALLLVPDPNWIPPEIS